MELLYTALPTFMEQCGGDVDFLKEILGDFMIESAQALQVIVDGMRARQFVMVMKAST